MRGTLPSGMVWTATPTRSSGPYMKGVRKLIGCHSNWLQLCCRREVASTFRGVMLLLPSGTPNYTDLSGVSVRDMTINRIDDGIWALPSFCFSYLPPSCIPDCRADVDWMSFGHFPKRQLARYSPSFMGNCCPPVRIRLSIVICFGIHDSQLDDKRHNLRAPHSPNATVTEYPHATISPPPRHIRKNQ